MATIRQKPEAYALTIGTHQRQRHFQRTANAELFTETLFRHRDQSRFALHAFVVMPDHVHVLITPAMDTSTARYVQFIKGGYSFAARKHSPGEIWHSGCHEHRIRDISDFENQKMYIANNPARKRYETYRHVHTAYAERIDGPPAHLAS